VIPAIIVISAVTVTTVSPAMRGAGRMTGVGHVISVRTAAPVAPVIAAKTVQKLRICAQTVTAAPPMIAANARNVQSAMKPVTLRILMHGVQTVRSVMTAVTVVTMRMRRKSQSTRGTQNAQNAAKL
jgi:beta-lactamase regulating signal transducer with metallopeptidase domain